MTESLPQKQLIQALTRFSNLPPEAGLPLSGLAEPERQGTAFYRFAIGETRWLFPTDQRAEAFSALDIAPLPGSEETLLGLAQIRGELTPVYQLHAPLGQTLASGPPRTLVFHLSDGMVGLIVDVLPERQWLDDTKASIVSTPPGLLESVASLIQSTVQIGEETYLRINLEKLGTSLRTLSPATVTPSLSGGLNKNSTHPSSPESL